MSSAFNERARGFTLIELLVVVSIIVIVSAASIPMALSFVRNYQVVGAANNVAGQMQLARAQAVKLNAQRGVLLNFNYPRADMYQWTSLEPNPMTQDHDGGVYPDFNPKNYDEGMANYGVVPAEPNNTLDPDLAVGVMSPHGVPVPLAGDILFDAGASNSLLFRSDGSVRAVNAGGPSGAGVITPNGLNFQLTVRDPNTNLARTVTITPNGRTTVEN